MPWDGIDFENRLAIRSYLSVGSNIRRDIKGQARLPDLLRCRRVLPGWRQERDWRRWWIEQSLVSLRRRWRKVGGRIGPTLSKCWFVFEVDLAVDHARFGQRKRELRDRENQ